LKNRRIALAKKRKNKQLQPSDFGTRERGQHDEIQLEETMVAGVNRARITTQTQLDRMYKRSEISYRQFDAGERFASAWYIGCRGSTVTANYDVRIPSSSLEVEQHVVRARRSVKKALDAVGPLAAIVVHVAGLDLPASEWAVMHDHDRRAGITVLRMALDALADHLGV
jgi:hypothetical protein